ncbi:MAG: hypothetical protein Q4P14_03455 [Methanobacteriaceae archaeon]|nr:hypothetical protein [Methanobacteriaceae archaeon]
MGTIINFKCENCNFKFQDKDLIFYLDEEDNLKEESLSLENSKLMTKSLLEGFLYESYCPHCNKLIKTYVPEMNNINLKEEEIIEIISKFNKNKSIKEDFKILIFDFKTTTYKIRREILENNKCPNCNKNMSLVISEKIPCPKCGNKLKEQN